MNQPEAHEVTSPASAPNAPDERPDHGINLVSVLVALAALAALVVGIFWALPAWFGSSVINVTVR